METTCIVIGILKVTHDTGNALPELLAGHLVKKTQSSLSGCFSIVVIEHTAKAFVASQIWTCLSQKRWCSVSEISGSTSISVRRYR
jgi:hypothetical protein